MSKIDFFKEIEHLGKLITICISYVPNEIQDSMNRLIEIYKNLKNNKMFSYRTCHDCKGIFKKEDTKIIALSDDDIYAYCKKCAEEVKPNEY